METLLQSLKSLGPMRLAIMGAVVVGMVAFFIFLTTKLTAPQMALLYADLQGSDTSGITSQLSSQNIPFELRAGGSEIHVPSSRVGEIRLLMAGQGLPSGGSIGYELFDQQSGMGSTNFQQNVNLVRALEGELARTISTIDSVRSARVHLVMPKRELFQRQQTLPSASIFLKMNGSNRLTAGQTSAVQHLVAAAVPSLSPQSISIIDAKGELLARGFEGDPTAPDVIAQKTDERKRAYQRNIAQTIEKLLEKSIGFGKVRAEVTADMDYDRISTNEELYDPDGQVVLSTQSLETTNSAQDREPPAVTVGNNVPDPNNLGADGASRNSSDSRIEETVNYAISKKVVNMVRDTGIVNRLSVAVLIDGSYAYDEDGDVVYRSRTPEEMDMLASLVRGAIGYSSARGDVVEVVNMRFADAEPEPDVPLDLFFGFEKQDLLRIAEMLVLTILAILVILLVVRPLISRAFEALPAAAGALAEGGRLIADQAQLAAGALAAPPGAGGEEEDEMFDDLIDLERVEGRVKASSVNKVGEIVDKHPDEALSIVRSWLYQES